MQKKFGNNNGPSSPDALLKQLKTPLLVLALFFDGRVKLKYKLLPLGAFLYVILPDLVPGPLDDALLAYLGPRFFLTLCRENHREVYREHYDKTWPKQAAK